MINMNITKEILDFIETLPPTVGVIGYGSGVKPQAGYKEQDQRQIDLFIIVQDLKLWHKENQILNPNHYTFTSRLFFELPVKFQHIGTDICYIPYLKNHNSIFKIGIIEEQDLLNDLNEWTTFFLAGRFQKDILVLKSDEKIKEAMEKNRKNAMILSLLLLDENHLNVKDLITQIVSFSYMGDPRMHFAENPQKIQNIVLGSYEELKNIYLDDTFYFVYNDDSIEIDYTEIFDYGLQEMPESIKEIFKNLNIKDVSLSSKEDLLKLRKALLQYFKVRNKKSGTLQALKGILTAGPAKSVEYGIEKLKKAHRKS